MTPGTPSFISRYSVPILWAVRCEGGSSMSDARPPKDNQGQPSDAATRCTETRKKARTLIERARDTRARAHQAFATTRQHITQADATAQHMQARRERQAEQGTSLVPLPLTCWVRFCSSKIALRILLSSSTPSKRGLSPIGSQHSRERAKWRPLSATRLSQLPPRLG